MKALFWILVVFLATSMVFRLFGRQIFNYLLKRVFKLLVKDAQQQAEDYRKYYETGEFRDNVYIDDEIQVTAPKGQPKKSEVTIEEIAEEVEFDEVN